MKHWEIIGDNLKKSGWSWGCVSTVDSRGRRIVVADAYRSDSRCFIVRADAGRAQVLVGQSDSSD